MKEVLKIAQEVEGLELSRFVRKTSSDRPAVWGSL